MAISNSHLPEAQRREIMAQYEETITRCQGCGSAIKQGQHFSRCVCLKPFCENGPACLGASKGHMDRCPQMKAELSKYGILQ